MRKRIDELKLSRAPLCSFGNQEGVIRGIREHRPLDLNAEQWRRAHPRGNFEEWRQAAHRCLLDGLHYDPGALDLKAEVLDRQERDGFTFERVAFNTTPWIRVNGFFLLPKGLKRPAPGLIVFHEWGGPILFGKERVASSGRDHVALQEHRAVYTSGRYIADEFARRGYAVIVIDAFHFGERIPRGLEGIPADLDPFALPVRQLYQMHDKVQEQLYLGLRHLNWAGTTWCGLNYWDDSRCVDYLLSRPEVDAGRIGCTGLSGGGWRTNILAALDRRIKASVSVCWMTTADYQQAYNVSGAIGPFCLLPGVWDRMDIPDLTLLAAPNASMVVSTSQDPLFPLEGQEDAARQIREGYAWAGCPEKFSHNNPPKGHCYDADIQRDAMAWFDRNLKG